MKLYIDTEFTGLRKDTSLISLGIISENNKTFYAEFTDYNKKQVDNWIKKNVINNTLYLKENPYPLCSDGLNAMTCTGSTSYIKMKLNQWLKQFENEEIQIISDVCHYDFVLFINIFGTAFDLPANISPAIHDINQDIASHFNVSEKDAFNRSREEMADELNITEKHNALFDAKIIKQICDKFKLV